MPRRSVEWQNSFLRALTDRLSRGISPTFNPRCITELSLYRLFDDLVSGDFSLRFPKSEIKAWLEDVGLLTQILLDEVSGSPANRLRFYRLDLVDKPGQPPSYLELLQAYHEEGVICYFSAIAYHSLSTQIPVQHHVAIPTEYRERAKAAPTAIPKRHPKVKADPLGTRLFSFEGIPYYKTSRERRLLPGVQLRFNGPTSVVRITTLEQTLLDTLHRPVSCGGPSVVFEAWERGLPKVDEDRLAEYLATMNHMPSVQRAGYILDAFGHKPGTKLREVLQSFLPKLDQANQSSYQQLFAGFAYHNLTTPWLVYGP